MPGDARCICGHYAAWHGGMGLGVPTFCKECRCSRFRYQLVIQAFAKLLRFLTP